MGRLKLKPPSRIRARQERDLGVFPPVVGVRATKAYADMTMERALQIVTGRVSDEDMPLFFTATFWLKDHKENGDLSDIEDVDPSMVEVLERLGAANSRISWVMPPE